MNEEIKLENGTSYKRHEMFVIGRAPLPMTQAEHVWQNCATEYTLKIDMVLSKVSLLASDMRAVTLIKELKEELIKTMISNSVGFTEEVETGSTNGEGTTEEPPKLNLV